ncbi:MAG: VOC family protein [Bacteroidota bacterium]
MMTIKDSWISITPVLPTNDMQRDVEWYASQLGFKKVGGDDMYAILKRDHLFLHLQWHSGTADDPVLGGSVIRIFVKDIEPIYLDILQRGAITEDRLRMDTPWGTHEFGLYDPNNNAIFFVADA